MNIKTTLLIPKTNTYYKSKMSQNLDGIGRARGRGTSNFQKADSNRKIKIAENTTKGSTVERANLYDVGGRGAGKDSK